MKYPYYIVPDVEEYKKLSPDSEEAKKLSRRIAVNIGDLASLRLLLGIDPPEFAKFYPDLEISTPSTMDTIDSFLDKFGGNIVPGGYIPGENCEIPQESYVLEEEEPDKKEETFEREEGKPGKEEEKFAQEEEKLQPAGPGKGEETDKSEGSELGNLIKQHKYQAAIQLIEGQNLKNPQKSIYFAHQIRFIKKLIAIDQYRNKTKG